jgi:tetrahydrodipicolinate N-succinyltransferase
MDRISGARPTFARIANENERVTVRVFVRENMPEVLDRYDRLEVRVMASRAEAAWENARALAKALWARIRKQDYEFIAVQLYRRSNVQEVRTDDRPGLFTIKSVGIPPGRLVHFYFPEAGK